MTSNFQLYQMGAAEDDPHLSVNTIIGDIDGILSASLTLPALVGNTATPTALQFQRNQTFIVTTGAAVGPLITLNIPTGIPRGIFSVLNSSIYGLEIKIAGQPIAAPTLSSNAIGYLHCDGTNVRALSVAANSYNLVAYIPGTLGVSTLLAGFVFASQASYVDNFVGSQAFAFQTDTVALNLDVKRNITSIGTISFAPSTAVGTFITAGSGPEIFNVGDRLTITSPAAPGLWQNISITFNGVQL
jgi:hypothetical protein